MKVGKLSLYKRIRKIKSAAYRRGRAENQAENEKFIDQLRSEKNNQWNTYQAEINQTNANHKKQTDTERTQHQDEIKTMRREFDEMRTKDKEVHKAHMINLKNEAVNRIKAINDRAKKEVERAAYREAEYQQLTSNTLMLFQEVMAKLKVYGEDQQSLMGNAASQIHKQNEIEKLYTRFVEMVKSNARLVGKMKVQQLEMDKHEG